MKKIGIIGTAGRVLDAKMCEHTERLMQDDTQRRRSMTSEKLPAKRLEHATSKLLVCACKGDRASLLSELGITDMQ